MRALPLTVVIPAYNEANRLPRTLERLRSWRPAGIDPIQLIVVDDGSTDNTREVARAQMALDPRLELVEASHGGTMHALLAGFPSARHGFIGNMDADGATDPSEFERLAPYLDEADIVTGSRILRGDLPEIEGKSPLRRALSGGMSLLCRLLFRCGVRDPQIGFKIYRRQALFDTLPLVNSKHDGIKSAELLVKAHALGYRIREIPVIHRHDPDSRCVPASPYRVVAGVFIAILGVWLDAARQFRGGRLKRAPVRLAVLADLLAAVSSRFNSGREAESA